MDTMRQPGVLAVRALGVTPMASSAAALRRRHRRRVVRDAVAFALAVALAFPAFAGADTWVIDTAHTVSGRAIDAGGVMVDDEVKINLDIQVVEKQG